MGFNEQNGVTLRAVSKDWQIFLDNVNDQEDMLTTIKGINEKKMRHWEKSEYGFHDIKELLTFRCDNDIAPIFLK